MKRPGSSNRTTSLLEALSSWVTVVVIILSLIAAYFIYHQILGNPANFIGDSNLNQPKKGNYLGVIYKGGPVVILLITLQIILITFIIERFINLIRMSGRVNKLSFIHELETHLSDHNISQAIEHCDSHHSALSDVMRSGLTTYMTVKEDEDFENAQRLLAIERAFEGATQLEIPPLNRNMVIVSTIASISTLIGLLGTVTGMIKAFSAMAQVGAPDAVGLAGGISQALVTTALGISTAAVGVVFFNFFTNKIDNTINTIDEVVFATIQQLKLHLKPSGLGN